MQNKTSAPTGACKFNFPNFGQQIMTDQLTNQPIDKPRTIQQTDMRIYYQ